MGEKRIPRPGDSQWRVHAVESLPSAPPPPGPGEDALLATGRAHAIRSVWHERPDGPPRRMAVLEEPDAARWQELGGRLVGRIEPRLGREVLANRATVGPDGWRLRPVGPALRRARRLAARLVTSWAAVIRTDVATFYPSVRPETLHDALEAAGIDAADSAEAASLLEAWGSHGYPGLPIGPPSSAVMANAVLRPVDRALAGFTFLRWVDDYVIGLPDPALGPSVLERIDETLDGLRLTRSAQKTTIAYRGIPWLGGTLSLPGKS